ncbi:MAG: hypothetical protein J1G02_04565 [Clostridiales bacterium]|nr:hypothetical protein [Clostridiales bacterium]
MKKFLSITIAVLIAFSALVLLVGCKDENNTQPTEKSGLIGTFTYSESIRTSEIVSDNPFESALRLYGSEQDAANGNLWCDVYPFNGIQGSRVSYTYDQRLQLKRDFTYIYQYTITLTNSEDWGNDFARMTIVMEGNYSYQDSGSGVYTVTLTDPYAGTQTVYGATAVRPGDVYGWTINSSATYVEDVVAELSQNADYSYNRYLKGRDLVVNKEDKSVIDNIFYRDIMNDIAVYSDYTF